MSLLNTFRVMSPSDTSEIAKVSHIFSEIDYDDVLNYANKKNGVGLGADAFSDALISASDSFDSIYNYVMPYMKKTIKHFKDKDSIRHAELYEDLADSVSNEYAMYGKDTESSFVITKEFEKIIEDFIEESPYKEPLEIFLMKNATDYLTLMEDIIYNDELTDLRFTSRGMSMKKQKEYFNNPNFITEIRDFAQRTSHIGIMINYYYKFYADFFRELSRLDEVTELNSYVQIYKTRYCYIKGNELLNSSNFSDSFIIDRNQVLNLIFDKIFESDDVLDVQEICKDGFLSENFLPPRFMLEGSIYTMLIDNAIYLYGDFEEILKNHIRNIMIHNSEGVRVKFMGEIGEYDLFVCDKFRNLTPKYLNYGGSNIRVQFQRVV